MSGTGDLPIDIVHPNIYLSFAKTELPLQITPSSAPRIRSINVGFPGWGAPAVLANVLVGSFPALQTLRARLHEPDEGDPDPEEDDEVLDPIVTVKALEIQHAPLLTEVVLKNCLLPWNANVYSHLTRLVIQVSGQHVILESEQQRPTHGQLLAIITSMTAIEELYLDIFPQYTNAAVQPIQFPPSCRKVMLDSAEPHLHPQCCRLAASFVLPPQATFIIKQASLEDTGLILHHFAGPSRPPLALSLNTDWNIDDESIIGTVIIPFDPNPWLETPADLLIITPPGHIAFQFQFFAFVSDVEPEDEARCRDSMFAALSDIDFGELRVLRIAGLKDDEDLDRLLYGYEDEEPVLAEADNVKVLVAPLDNIIFIEQLLDVVDTGEPPLPLLDTFVLPTHPTAEPNEE